MTDLKKELLRFKDIVDGMIDDSERKAYKSNDFNESISLIRMSGDAHTGINAILELAEELEKDK